MDEACGEVLKGHVYCVISMLVCGSAFVFTKKLLSVFSPGEMVFLRFLTGYIALWIINPRRLVLRSVKEELLCAAGGLVGITAYYWIQNISLIYTSASNVSVLVSLTPMLTALFAFLIDREVKTTGSFVAGLFVSLVGVVLVVSNGKMDFEGGMWGNFLAFVSAVLWACYSVIVKKIEGYSMVLITRRIIFYGLVTMMPILLCTGCSVNIQELIQLPILISILYLGCMSSALINVLWNFAFQMLGVVKTNIYMYTLPVITIIFSYIILHESITIVGMVGIVITIAGMVLSQKNEIKKDIFM